MPKLTSSDVVAGASVAMVLIPQSLAYAELAGLPPFIGLFAAAFPLLAFALLASSPYLQTGPVAVTSLLTLSALPDVDASEIPKLAALLALLVGVARLVLGIGRLGNVVRLMSSPVVLGFTNGAAIVIIASQLPKALGADPPDGSVLGEFWWAITHPDAWTAAAIFLSLVTVLLFRGPRLIQDRWPWLRLFPGVLVAVVIGIVFSRATGYTGRRIDDIPEGLPPFSLSLPWDQVPALLVGAIVIALVGFAEPASIARTFANETGQRWNANQEMFASGVANVVAAFSGAYPVGGSFSRSSVNRLAGAETRWSGGVTGVIVLAFLPFASVLEPLPTAVLGAIVCGAVVTLLKPRILLGLWKRSPAEALLAWCTFAATIIVTPKVERAVIIGVALTIAVHFLRRFNLQSSIADDGQLEVEPVGLLWLGSRQSFESSLRDAAASTEQSVVINFEQTPFLDDAIVDSMAQVANEMQERGQRLSWRNQPVGSEKLLAGVYPE